MLQTLDTAYAHASISLSLVRKEKEKKSCYFFIHTFPLISNSCGRISTLCQMAISVFPCSHWNRVHFMAFRRHCSVVQSFQCKQSQCPHPPSQASSRATCSNPRDVTTRKSSQKCLCNQHIINRLCRAGQECSFKCREKTEELLPPIFNAAQKSPNKEMLTLVVLKKPLSALFSPYYFCFKVTVPCWWHF